MNTITGARQLRILLMLLILTLTFEGIVRKAAPGLFNYPVFFAKDIIVLVLAFYVFRWPPVAQTTFLWNAYGVVALFFIPSILWTFTNSPILAIYGAKQYLYYPIVAFATFYAFQNQRTENIVAFFKWCTLLLVPTVMLATLQLHLSSESWLNRTVGGDDLSAFSSGGFLRVSSTFPFVAQYCTFLAAELFMLALIWSQYKYLSVLWKIIAFGLLPAYVLSCYTTGSRGAVLGAVTIAGVATVLVALKWQVRHLLQMGGLLVLLYGAVFALHHFFPDSFAAYSERENGNLLTVSSENQTRVLSQLTVGLGTQQVNLIGYGLGTMSNGADMLSSYARKMRNSTYWTETDLSTTYFEGGFYLVMVWYWFRAYVIWKIVLFYLQDVGGELTFPMAFSVGYVVIGGVFGTLALQPPTAIWWWMAVGMSLVYWQRTLAPDIVESDSPDNSPPPTTPYKRGRSAYAEALHAQSRRKEDPALK